MSIKEIKVVLVGPCPAGDKNAHAGGVGGYYRNMQVYLAHQPKPGWEYLPCFTALRQKDENVCGLFVRLIKDISSMLLVFPKGDVVHVMGQYRGALPREFLAFAMAFVFGVPFVYEIKAGAFQDWAKSVGSFKSALMSMMLRRSAMVLCEGIPDINFIKVRYGVDGVYLPNVVPDSEVPGELRLRLGNPLLRLLYVGYCYEGKGVVDLVEAILLLKKNGVEVILDLVGSESAEFKVYMNDFMAVNEGLKINRVGAVGHADVLNYLDKSDVFCFPTRHPGEGHSNAINEAMMRGLVIVCTRHGFLPSVLGEHAYYVEKKSPNSIAFAIKEIGANRGAAREKTIAAYNRLKAEFVSSTVFGGLGERYKSML